MKIVAIGDIHGRDVWEKIVAKETDADKIVLEGDYFDTRDNISAHEQIDNFNRIVAFKKANPDKTVLLIGNHDYHYMRGVYETYSGYQAYFASDIQEALHAALDEDLLQMVYIHEDFLFVHAGITRTWLSSIRHTDEEPLDIFLNDLFKYHPRLFSFSPGALRDPYGNETCQSPIWVRPESLQADMLFEYTQIVGHTTKNHIKIIVDRLALIDTAGREYLVIEDKDMLVKKVDDL